MNSESKRKTLACVMQSQTLYTAPVWNNATNNKVLTRKLTRVQRLMSIRVTRTYRTISAEAFGVIAAIPPIDLLINERAKIYNGQNRATAQNSLRANWQERCRSSTTGRWTHRIITNISNWQNRRYGEVDY
ncbi:uncharacterized protein LOC115890565 [Sitophilus oryzae]|uniref:Uncharacterized protein LOC115890565 n=1 Tax=Sitophilus oryzae TaxID=7048 RepID=A0A6J2YV28_SITOR|nr:uncharacterized protein LOC115890565 [Sitophilus oryzae]